MGETMFGDLASVRDGLKDVDYLADDGIASVVFLAEKLGKPVLVEGPAGTGKTELANSVAAMTDARLIRLQCYEGLDEAKALYEWNYKKQLLRIQADRGNDANNEDWADLQDDIFNDEFLLTRPLLEAITAEERVVLLIDEVDRVEIETEALLLEILSDYQVSIPELGTIEAKQIPIVFLTSNNTRELSEALKRRCLFLHIDYPQLEREKEIVLTKGDGISATISLSKLHESCDRSGRLNSRRAPRFPKHSTGPEPSCCWVSRVSTWSKLKNHCIFSLNTSQILRRLLRN